MKEVIDSFKPTYEYSVDKADNLIQVVIPTSDYNNFNSSLLDLGDIGFYSQQKDVIAAIFDLEGFTEFCSGVDPQLFVPSYLKDFVDWLYSAIKIRLTNDEIDEDKSHVDLFSELPFFSKFLGDGVLLLWNIDSETIIKQYPKGSEYYFKNLNLFLCNIIVSLEAVCSMYDDFYNEILRKKYVTPPSKLRCGIARGTVFSIGDGEDYVGPCINMASRLQKLHGLGFAFQARGIDVDEGMEPEVRDTYLLKEVEIRGMGKNEHIYVDKDDFENLDDCDKLHFIDI